MSKFVYVQHPSPAAAEMRDRVKEMVGEIMKELPSVLESNPGYSFHSLDVVTSLDIWKNEYKVQFKLKRDAH